MVRRLIAEHGLDPSEIVGSGAGGRITRDDVLATIERQGSNGGGVPREGALLEDVPPIPAPRAVPCHRRPE